MEHTLEEVRLEIDLKQITTQTFYGVIKGEDMYPLSVFDVEALMDVDDIAQLDT